jgi:hypothetical protein
MEPITLTLAAILIGASAEPLAEKLRANVSIDAGASIEGPVVFKDANGLIILDLPKGSYIRTVSPAR